MNNRSRRILVVDDSHAILVVMQAILSELDIEHVTAVDSAAKALEKIRQSPYPYDAIFTDLNMPEMDGMEFIRHLGEIHYPGGIIIISEMENRIIDLAANLARQHCTHLIGNIAKPVQLIDVERNLKKLDSFVGTEEEYEQPITEEKLLEAISQHEITPFYQPKVHRGTKQIKSIEVLARIVSKEHGQVMLPKRFIGVAEDLDLINLLTFQLFEKAATEFQLIRNELNYPFKLAFNLSPIQLNDTSCPDKLALILELNRLKPQEVIVEITEHQPIVTSLQLETINRLRLRGFDLALDDFGTGFTNIHQLKTLPFTEIKIDRSLITYIESDRFSQVLVDSLIDIAQNEQLDIVAEGIERIEELQYLERYKFSLLMQGYLISRPKALSEFVRWIHSWERMINSNP
ncbi:MULTISPECIES: EAL domain-containing response regulator [Pseudoalteromonas]|uniref:EAL domain-containing response regulator n=1 Tax=Pseudoalteromonas obscura TaxID=3048491 RepID=A0ABT7ER09_9GAMM|nr:MULTISPECIES: EAL domain-containing response regulator [Pseudoalteromonas]MBQ4838175.1 EAL domain-containing response regulator [Pseudoalteromonas luteoviolacea]MDK2597486.1 EAL domain-containing response regulator [Pseudoalteromonas sp. P94(2023)]